MVKLPSICWVFTLLIVVVNYNGGTIFDSSSDATLKASNKLYSERNWHTECHRWMSHTSKILGDNPSPLLASVIIVTHNENEHILQATLISLMANTSEEFLKEVIVVDDFSQFPVKISLGKVEPRVSIIRNAARQGLIRSRLIGVNEASGDILIFADSHIRFAKNWLKPIILRLLSYQRFENQRGLLVLSPFISAFTENGQEYPAVEYLRGGFTWDLSFVWEPMNENEKDTLNSFGRQMNLTWRSLPRPTPVIAGSVIAVLRTQFLTFGAFDSQMEVWGGENLELSFRAWMCNGRVEIIPCSRVSHLFRDSHAYSFPEDKVTTITRNLKRVSTVWMEPSKGLKVNSAKFVVPPIALFYSSHQECLKVSAGDISRRKRLKHKLGCKDFAWFVDNVYPELRKKADFVKLRDNAIVTAHFSDLIKKFQ
uniref:Glyco_trans_2-like domain-containing protein n=2 Tax=Mesocestoides corti TaxID=53468 RepID=A0A5K3F8F6_MESCO